MPLSGRDPVDPTAPPLTLESSSLMSTSLGRSAFRTIFIPDDATLGVAAVDAPSPSPFSLDTDTSSNTRSWTPGLGTTMPPAATGLATWGESSANTTMATNARTLRI